MNAQRAKELRRLKRHLELRSAEGTAAEKRELKRRIDVVRKGGPGWRKAALPREPR